MSGKRLGRYIVHGEIASGGMATIHLGRLVGPAGFGRTVAIKRLLPRLARDPEFVSSFVDEARLAARIRHPNVVATLDVVVVDGDETIVVMEYVHGESWSRLLRKGASCPPLPITLAVVCQMLAGLHAAHEATGPGGKPLELVHRDVSPQNVLVGADGSARLLDFGIAKAAWRLQQTRDATLKGKLGYMAPEQLQAKTVDRRADVFAASVVLWEALTGKRLFARETPAATAALILAGEVAEPSSLVREVPPALDRIVRRGLAGSPAERFATALEMAEALESAGTLATAREVSAWVSSRASATLALRGAMVRALEDESEGGAGELQFPGLGAPALVQASLDRARRQEEPTAPGADAPPPPPVPAAPPAPRERPGSRRWIAGLLALVVAVGLAVALRTRRGTSAAPLAGAPSLDLRRDAATLPVFEEAPPPPAPSVAALASTGSTARAPAPRPRSVVPRLAPSAKPGCDPPYTVGPEGIRRFRPECI